jgi:hypothetical protein
MHRDDRVAEPVPAQVHPFAPVCRTFLLHVSTQLNQLAQEVQEDYDGYGAHVPAIDPPEAFPGVQPHLQTYHSQPTLSEILLAVS